MKLLLPHAIWISDKAWHEKQQGGLPNRILEKNGELAALLRASIGLYSKTQVFGEAANSLI